MNETPSPDRVEAMTAHLKDVLKNAPPLRIVKDVEEEYRDKAVFDLFYNDGGKWSDELLEAQLDHIGIQLRFNSRKQATEWTDKPDPSPSDWEEMTDRKESKIFQTIAKTTLIKKPDPRSRSFIIEPSDWGSGASGSRRNEATKSILYDRSVDPFRMWLESLPEWDGQARLDSLLIRAGFDFDAATDLELLEWAARIQFLAAVKRAYTTDGVKHDIMTILIGEQGCGKSTFWKHCLPSEFRKDWYTDHLNLAGTPQQMIEATLGNVIVEASEIVGMSWAQVEHVKSYISREVDKGVRMAYAKNTETIPRRFILVGTTNNENALPNDLTGNRRFLAVKIETGNDPVAIEAYAKKVEAFWSTPDVKEQVWAEAKHRALVDNEQHWLPGRLARAQKETNEQFRNKDLLLEEWLSEYLEPYGDREDNLTMPNIMGDVNAVHSLRNVTSKRVGAILRGWDWDNKYRPVVNGRMLTCWYKK